MQPTDWSQIKWRQRVLAFGLGVLLVGTAFASVAAADSAIGIRNAEVSATTVTVGENVTVSAEAVNVGDSRGGFTFDFERNGTTYGTRWTTFDEIRVTISPDEYRQVSTNIQFDKPGTYKIRVNQKNAGVVRVKSSRTRVAAETDSQRRIDARANGVSAGESIAFDIPSSNRAVALQQWTTTTGQSAFQQYLTEYTNRSEVPGTVPTFEQSTLLGVVDFESEDEFQDGTMQIGVNDSLLANSTLERDEVTVYQRNGSTWERLETSVVADEGTTRTVYEATATRGTTYAVGRIDPDISIENTTYGTTDSANGARMYVDARLQNTAPIAGSYTGVLRVNGEAVNRTTVTVPASGETNISLSHEVSAAGSYRLKLNSTSVGSVFIPESQVTESEPADSEPTAAGTAAATATGTAASDSGDSGGAVADAVPSTILGIQTVYVAGGLAIALGAFVVILLLLRRGGGGGGRPDSFDPF